MYPSDVDEIRQRRFHVVHRMVPVDEHQRRVTHQRVGVRSVGTEVFSTDGRRFPVHPHEHRVREQVIECVRQSLREIRGHRKR